MIIMLVDGVFAHVSPHHRDTHANVVCNIFEPFFKIFEANQMIYEEARCDCGEKVVLWNEMAVCQYKPPEFWHAQCTHEFRKRVDAGQIALAPKLILSLPPVVEGSWLVFQIMKRRDKTVPGITYNREFVRFLEQRSIRCPVSRNGRMSVVRQVHPKHFVDT